MTNTALPSNQMVRPTTQELKHSSCITQTPRLASNSDKACPGLESLQCPTPSVRDLLHSNAEPELADSQQIQANLVYAVKEFEELSAQWPESQRTRHEGAIRLHRSALSVVRRLPNDILRLIFLAVVEDVKPRDRLDTKAGAWSVSRVCARWRDVALSTPSLWSTIYLESRQSPWLTKLPMPTVNAIVDTCLFRAGRAPIDLSVSSSLGDHSRLTSVCPTICLHASHWNYVALCPLTDLVLEYLATVKNVPLLKHVSLVIATASIDPRDKRLDFLLSAPRLQHVCLVYPCGEDVPLLQHFPWKQLLSFTLIAEAPVLDLAEVLHRCTKLLNLSINCPDFIFTTKSPVVLPCLTSLTLWLRRVIADLQYVTVPSLKYLTLGAFAPDIDTETSVSMILEHSRCPLLEFHYYCLDVSVGVIKGYLKAAPTLRKLALDIFRLGVENQRELLLMLTCREDGDSEEVIVPALEDLTINLAYRRHCLASDFTELSDAMIASRSARGNFKAQISMDGEFSP